MRLFALSDIHVDYEVNLQWVNNLSMQDYQDDALLLGGDITDTLSLLETTLNAFLERFSVVFFVPGNHDIWIRGNDFSSSMDKFYEVLELARRCGAYTGARTLGKTQILPLFSWYDFSFGAPSAQLVKAWMDFYRCRWPEELDDVSTLNDYFLSLNQVRLQDAAAKPEDIISFSHFLPRIDIMPSRIPPKHRIVYPVLGSTRLDVQLRDAGVKTHVYGHSHVNRDITIDGIRYVNCAFGYPQETWNQKALWLIADTL